MAAVKLVPPAVLEGMLTAPSMSHNKSPLLEIHRRQMVCRAELGNWWERQHSKVHQYI